MKTDQQKSPQKFILNISWGIALALILLFVFAKLASGVLRQEILTFDVTVGDFVRSNISDGLTTLAVFITELGSAKIGVPVFLLVSGILFFRFKHFWEPVMLGVSLAGGWLLNEGLKHIFKRSRPSLEHLVEAGGYSFPSGHSMVSVAFYGMIGYLIWLNLRERGRASWYMPPLTIILIFAIGLSRIYLGVHYPSDVVAGFAVGGVWLMASIFALHAIRLYKSKRKQQTNSR